MLVIYGLSVRMFSSPSSAVQPGRNPPSFLVAPCIVNVLRDTTYTLTHHCSTIQHIMYV